MDTIDDIFKVYDSSTLKKFPLPTKANYESFDIKKIWQEGLSNNELIEKIRGAWFSDC